MSQRYHVQVFSQVVGPAEWKTILQRDDVGEALDMQEHYRSTYPTWRVRTLDTATAALLDQLELPGTPQTPDPGPPARDLAVDTHPGSSRI